MILERLEYVVQVEAPTDAVWRFFSNPHNLPRITPPWLDLRIVSPAPERIYPGLILEYRVRPTRGLRVAWVTEITHVREGELFVDEQRFGPYHFWHHQHLFRATGRSVEVRDVVHYLLPGGFLGRPFLRRWVGRQLEAIFAYRQEAVRRLLREESRGGGQVPLVAPNRGRPGRRDGPRRVM